MSANKHNTGFTLLELIIATFIGTMLIMASAYAIKTGLSSMEKEEAWFNDLAVAIKYWLSHDKVIRAKTWVRKERNLDAIFRNYLEPLLHSGGTDG